MRDILSLFEENNFLCGEGRRKGLYFIYLKNKSYISFL